MLALLPTEVYAAYGSMITYQIFMQIAIYAIAHLKNELNSVNFNYIMSYNNLLKLSDSSGISSFNVLLSSIALIAANMFVLSNSLSDSLENSGSS